MKNGMGNSCVFILKKSSPFIRRQNPQMEKMPCGVPIEDHGKLCLWGWNVQECYGKNSGPGFPYLTVSSHVPLFFVFLYVSSDDRQVPLKTLSVYC